MADIYLKEPVTKTEAYKRTHPSKANPDSLNTLAAREFRKGTVLSYLAKYSDMAEQGITEIAQYSKEYGKNEHYAKGQGSAYAGVALKAYSDILDRVHGKAKQSLEIDSRHIDIIIDLSQQ